MRVFAMELFTKLFGDLLLFVYHCFDRIVIHGLYEGRGVNRFLEPCHNPLHRASPIARCAGSPPSCEGASFHSWHEEPLAWPR
jgi:hypothetical protein